MNASARIENNFAEITLGALTVWFFYRTLIAFHTPATGLVVSENAWKQTAGKHINSIDSGSSEAKARRLPRAEFEAKANTLLGSISAL